MARRETSDSPFFFNLGLLMQGMEVLQDSSSSSSSFLDPLSFFSAMATHIASNTEAALTRKGAPYMFWCEWGGQGRGGEGRQK